MRYGPQRSCIAPCRASIAMTATDYHCEMNDPLPPGDRAAALPPQPPVGMTAGTIVDTDVLVIGGGPAGATAAALLARKGWKVLLLEKDRHPRFHIGESLLPMNLPILQRLGVLEQVAAIGLYKAGADFPVPGKSGGKDYNTFRFERALNPVFPHAYQVHRAEFDQLLFAHAQASGVDAREGVKVEKIEFGADGRPLRALARDAAGAVLQVTPRYIVDASGRDTFFGNHFKLKRRNERHQSAAIFSHFEGVERRPGNDSGNISVQRFAHGWMWLIPLPRDVMSIGAVCFPSYLKQRRGESENFLMDTLLAQPPIAARMQGATRVAPVHVTGNYAYGCTRMHGPGWVMAGDAYAFVDPIFSSGVFLAMDSAEQAANVVDGALRDPSREAALQAAMARRMDRGLRWFQWFIYRFNTPVMKHLFANPRNILQVEQSVISMLAGDIFDNPAVIWRLRVFRVIYALTALQQAPAALRAWLRRRRAAREDFSGDTLQRGNP